MSLPRALVLDKDGVLVDFVHRWVEVARRRAEHLAAATRQDAGALLRLMGVVDGRVDPLGPLAAASRVETRAVVAGYLYTQGQGWLEAIAHVDAAFLAADPARARTVAPGPLLEPLGTLHAAGIKLAIATSDTSEAAARDLAALGIDHLFSAIWGAERVAAHKPHPAIFWGACEELGVAPEHAWMVGDSLADVRTGRAAGAGRTVGLTSGVMTHEQLAAEADVVLAGVWELPGLLGLSGHVPDEFR